MLKLFNITKTFNPGTITEKKAIRGVDLEIDDGDFITVIGGNGAGKSTLLNIIAGVHYTDTGSIELDGKNLTGKPEHYRAQFLGRVFQDPMMGTAANMEIEENLAMAMRRGKKRGLAWYIKNEEKELLDPKTAKKVLELTEELVKKDNLTTFMVTHNMKDAIRYGNRLIMMMDGRIVYDVRGEEKKNLKVEDLLEKFNASGVVSDKLLG